MRSFALAFALLAATVPDAAISAPRPVEFAPRAPAGGTLVLPLGSAEHLAQARDTIDDPARQSIARALTAAEFDFKRGSTLSLRGIGSWDRILVIGVGEPPFAPRYLQDVGGTAAQETKGAKGPVTVLTQTIPGAGADGGLHIATGAKLGGYAFDRYKSMEADATPGAEGPLVIVAADPQLEARYRRDGAALAEGVTFARDLAQEPANVLYPQAFVERARKAFAGVRGVSIEVLDVSAMERLGMGAILGVGQGSERPPRMMVVRYRGSPNAPLVALAGKGITFDSGGISLKPGNGMWAMKGDMGGAAAVTGAVLSLAKSGAPVNVIGIAALAENMPGGGATRPGDVLKAYNGKTIEVLNTDAEGRLVLADAVSYAERQYRPAAIVDIATLTGAVSTALGDEYAGLFSRNDALAQQLLQAGTATGEELWRLPLHDNYAKDMKSKIADLQNVKEGGGPGAGLGAQFIGEFVANTPWAHLDIAGVDLRSSALPTVPEGLSGFGVRLLDRFVRDFRAVPASAPAPGAAVAH